MADSAPYLCFNSSTPEAKARAVFQKRFGSEPARCFVSLGLLRAGPVPERNGFHHGDTDDSFAVGVHIDGCPEVEPA